MSLRWALLSLVGLTLSAPADATTVTWRASGTVDSLIGTTALLPLPASVGDIFDLQFSYDDATSDVIPANPNQASYPILSLTVTIAGTALQFVGPGSGEGHIGIQANSINPNLWGVNGCIGACDQADYDEARLNFFFPVDTITSDVLTNPPDPTGATVQLGLFSRESATVEAFLVANLESVTQVPEPAAAWSMMTAIAAFAGCRRFARAR